MWGRKLEFEVSCGTKYRDACWGEDRENNHNAKEDSSWGRALGST